MHQHLKFCICICMNTLKIPILALIQREREHILIVSESRFEALNGGSANYIFLHVVPLQSNIVLLKNEFLYCSVLHWILSKRLCIVLDRVFYDVRIDVVIKSFRFDSSPVCFWSDNLNNHRRLWHEPPPFFLTFCLQIYFQ